MKFSDKYIYASSEFNNYDKFVPAPLFRKSFVLENLPEKCGICIGAAGFYRLWINGTEITKGIIAPYVSNPDDIVYYDYYDLKKYLSKGVNVLGFMLGNGFQNNPGGSVWDFHAARFRGAPRFAFALSIDDAVFEADESVKTASSALYFDDMRCGERYDARNEIDGWNLPSFDDSEWSNSLRCEAPRGEFMLCDAEPVKPTGERIKAVKIYEGECAPYTKWHPKAVFCDLQEKAEKCVGFIYDFGVNKAGITQLKINGYRGQRIEMQFGEFVDENGKLHYDNIDFYPDGYSQRDVYICKGEGTETYSPNFTYHGFRYCCVSGITREQATEDLLTYVICNSDLKKRASFCCSDKTADKLYEMCCASDMSNFYYFPTDCPHREKNGWTGDIALSAEHLIMNYDCEKSFAEWLRNVRKAQMEDGSLPSVVPTCDWGRKSGPNWDAALIYVPYYTYVYTKNKKILEDNAHAIFSYLGFLSTHRTERGTLDLYLGDWCPVGNVRKATTEFTDSVAAMSICQKASFIFGVLGFELQKEFADKLYSEIRSAVRKHFVDVKTLIADVPCQTSQAMAIYFDVFDEEEKQKAFEILLEMIHKNNGFIDFGILGARVLFHVLSEFGEADLAYNMICRPEWPSYGYFIEQGYTSVPENFVIDENDIHSLNHHFYGDISNWFISSVGGIKYNPDGLSHDFVLVKPSFIASLDYAKASFESPFGRIATEWKRNADEIALTVEKPLCVKCGFDFGNMSCINGREVNSSFEKMTFVLKNKA